MNHIAIDQITNSNVLVRVNFDIPDLDHIQRIEDSLETLKYLYKNNNNIALLSHWGRPNIDSDDVQKYSLKLQLDVISRLFKNEGLPIPLFHNQFSQGYNQIYPIPFSRLDGGMGGQIVLFENTRFHLSEQKFEFINNVAKEYSQGFDYFVDEAFSVSHRKEGTNYGLKHVLDYCFGLSYSNETHNLDLLKQSPHKPYTVILGGAKLETKLPLLEKLLPIADYVLVAGLSCYPFYQIRNPHQTKYTIDCSEEILTIAQRLIDLYDSKIISPIDFVPTDQSNNPCDIGPQTIELFQSYILPSKTVFWNGPLGLYEDPRYKHGTDSIGKMLAQHDGFDVLGGGDTASALPKEILVQLDFVSMGGGATLEYLSL